MKNSIYQNTLINKKQLKQLLAWSFTQYNSMQACSLADELKYLGFKYASQAGISISIEDLRVPFNTQRRRGLFLAPAPVVAIKRMLKQGFWGFLHC